ncbi:hypothetical protein AXF42_Ash014428 [Apostasia shenzhenica]|uniref:Uncharacterized protein n=1 Tax=Apostasia shenzhenica TaxID=1088818 RepID=A0A2H9ZWH5_9ASPA|nr:hypothetical protein AXF42_Ash014428 [Apostasia shenzhenica]
MFTNVLQNETEENGVRLRALEGLLRESDGGDPAAPEGESGAPSPDALPAVLHPLDSSGGPHHLPHLRALRSCQPRRRTTAFYCSTAACRRLRSGGEPVDFGHHRANVVVGKLHLDL